MFSISGITLTVSLCGSLEDCAAHMLSLSDSESSRHRLDTLATIGSAAKNGRECLDILASVFIFPTLLFSLVQIAGQALTFSLSSFLGGLLGIVSIFLFLGLVFLTMGRSYGVILHQARRQFRTDDTLLDNIEVPDYFPCVKHGMLHALPGCLLLVLFPLLLVFSAGKLLGFSGLIGVLSTIAVFTLTISLLFTQIGGITNGARRRIGNTRHENSNSSAHRYFLTIERIFAIFHQGLVPTLTSFAHLTVFLSVLLYLSTSSL